MVSTQDGDEDIEVAGMLMNPLLTAQVSALAHQRGDGVTPDAVRAAERRGELKASRAGTVRLFDRRDVEAWLDRRARRQARREAQATSR